MKIWLHEVEKDRMVEGLISPAEDGDVPLKKAGWQFNWKQLIQVEGAAFYKLVTLETPKINEGMLMLTLINEEMVYLNNIEIAPHNYGSNGKYENVAGGLLAFACYKSFELGRNYYLGYVAFDSKTSLIELYQNKYGATLAIGQKMFFDPEAGKALLKKYLMIDITQLHAPWKNIR